MQNQTVKKHNIIAAVTNFNMSDAADMLKKGLVEHGRGRFEVTLIDSSSSKRPELADEVITNEYYTGLWNKSVQMAIKRDFEWLFFVASDVQIESIGGMCDLICSASEDTSIGVYCPSVDNKSRFSFKDCEFKGTKTIRDCKSIEGFCFLARTKVLREIHPVTDNKYGYCIDKLTCDIAKNMGYRVVVDDRATIHHPKSESSIDKGEATHAGMAFYWTRIKAFEKKLSRP